MIIKGGSPAVHCTYPTQVFENTVLLSIIFVTKRVADLEGRMIEQKPTSLAANLLLTPVWIRKRVFGLFF